jgi:hypothetical protein
VLVLVGKGKRGGGGGRRPWSRLGGLGAGGGQDEKPPKAQDKDKLPVFPVGDLRVFSHNQKRDFN